MVFILSTMSTRQGIFAKLWGRFRKVWTLWAIWTGILSRWLTTWKYITNILAYIYKSNGYIVHKPPICEFYAPQCIFAWTIQPHSKLPPNSPQLPQNRPQFTPCNQSTRLLINPLQLMDNFTTIRRAVPMQYNT